METDIHTFKQEPDFYVQSGRRHVGVLITLLGKEGVKVSFEDKENPMNLVIPIPLRKPDFSRPESNYDYLSQFNELKETTQKIADFVFHFLQQKDVYTEMYKQVERRLREKELWIYPDFSKDRMEEKKRIAAGFQREKQLFEEKMTPTLEEHGIQPGLLLDYLLNVLRSHPYGDSPYFRPYRKSKPFIRPSSWIG